MKARIHRGARQIGGSCIELESAGHRLLLDLGRPLEAKRDEIVPLPQVSGLFVADPTLLGILLSHPHQDHWGQIPDVHLSVPLYAGAIAGKMLREAAFFGAGKFALTPLVALEHRIPLQIGPFCVTPFAADHSATDAYSLLIEAGGKKLFYTGDFRAHGRHQAKFVQLLADPPEGVDSLMLEGTHVRPDGTVSPRGPSENDVRNQFEKTLQHCAGPVLAAFSAQNIDRLCSIYEACLAANRTLILDLYAATMAEASGEKDAPKPGKPNFRIWVPQSQRVRVKKAGAFERVAVLGKTRIFPEEMAKIAEESVLLYRDGLARDLERSIALVGATLVWSLWPGYLDADQGAKTREQIKKHQWSLVHHHASGHAAVSDLQALVRALKPKNVVPIHTFGSGSYSSLFANVAVHRDGEWWEV